nr:DEAD/DEAH box helicase family protein [Halochromatium glycolicum]
MVLVATEQKLMIMRPCQIYAVKAIIDCILQNRGNGYIWHTTGSGKTLTSFKASTLLKDNPEIEKCLFVVDRKDLDRQTRLEFNKFQEAGQGLSEDAIRDGYQNFKAEKTQDALADLAARHGLAPMALQGFVDGVLDRLIFDGEALTELFAPLELGWKARGAAELALMAELVPLLKKQAGGREISGLAAYEH